MCSLKIDKNVGLCLHRIILVLHAPRYKESTLLAAQWAVQEAAQLTAQDLTDCTITARSKRAFTVIRIQKPRAKRRDGRIPAWCTTSWTSG